MEIKNKKITLIVPFYNEENGVLHFFERVNQVFSPILGKYNIEVICINDGSRDRTLDELLQAKETFHWIKIIDFSRNFGKEAAVTAGLDFSDGDAVIPIDSDLQHPPELILDMLERWENGFDVVLAKRIDRDTDSAIQKMTARIFYKVSNKISHVEIPADVGDFRLMDRKVAEATRTLRENSRFMKGIFAWVGFRTTTMEYKVEPREHGKSSFNTWKLWNFALEGITSFSTVPLRVWSYIGGIISLFAFLYSIYLILKTVFLGIDTPGYASLMVVILFSTGIQLIGIGILGEYIGRVFLEVKNRPIYIVRKVF